MKIRFTISFIISIFAISSFAQEGMWLLNQIENLELNKKGLQITPYDIYNPDQPALYNAIVKLGGGTASFVSSEGLLVTNHHVAYSALQRASSVENDYLNNGFLAKNRSEEIQAPGYRAQILLEMKDVTDEVLLQVKDIIDPLEKSKKIDLKIAEITDAIKAKREDITAVVSEMYNGSQYFLFVYEIFKDVRLVYAPPHSIGNYGGEIDNWMWPRHTGDFTFLRVYTSPDGKDKEYSKDNIPYKPKVWLKAAEENLKDGDLTFILGFPGTTTRYRTSYSADWSLNNTYPFVIKNYKELLELLDAVTENNPEGKLRVANMCRGLANTMKNYQGKVEGMKKTNFIQTKINFENKLMSWVNSDNERKEKYESILDDIKALYSDLEKTKDKDNAAGLFSRFAGTQLNAALKIYLYVKEFEKPESERKPGIEKSKTEIINSLRFVYADYFEPAERALMIRALKIAAGLQPDQRINELEYIFDGESIEKFVDNAFNSSKLNEYEFAKSLFEKTSEELESLNDPFINFAVKLYPLTDKQSKNSKAFNAMISACRKSYIDVLRKWKGNEIYPDANGTMRFTSGNIKGYSPADAVWYQPFTTLKGVAAKNTGVEPFDAPGKLLELNNTKDYGNWVDPVLQDVPVAFTHQCDITGGNSGSPVMNAKGEIIGLAFDGNYEAMVGDWQYDYDLQRTISVDMRYVLFITEKFAGAGYILYEMGIKKTKNI